jgi:hypothetical protein
MAVQISQGKNILVMILGYGNHIIREFIEIQFHSNLMNMEESSSLSISSKPLINVLNSEERFTKKMKEVPHFNSSPNVLYIPPYSI